MTLTPAESCAAAQCWLARWQQVSAVGAVIEQVATFWHPGTCRFCKIPLDELMGELKSSMDPMETKSDLGRRWQDFKNLPNKARIARIREAQEEDWFAAVTG